MRFEYRIALRYLWTARKQLHTAFLSLISTVGLAVGVATLIISLALLSGLQGKIKARLMASSPHLFIESAESHAIESPEPILARAAQLGGKVEPRISGIGWVSNEENGIGRPVRVSTIPRETEAREGERVLYLTRDLAASLRLREEDRVVIVGPRARLTPFGPAPIWRRYESAKFLPPVSEEKEPQAFLPFSDASTLFMTGGGPTEIEVWLGDAGRVEELQEILRREFPQLTISSWKELNRPLFLALRLEKIVMFATISLIILVAALNLISSLSMLIVEKRPRVGILRTLGATEGAILRIFVSVGLLIGLAGTVLGNILGLGLAWLANRYELVPLPGAAYALTHVPVSIDLPDLIGVNVIAIVLSMLATWYPARLASRLDPIEAIREE